MNLKPKIAIPALSLVFFAFLHLANTSFSDKIITLLNQYILKTPQEKVYLHFDKPYYMAGETIWYKGYLFSAETHSIDSFSRVLYVDLIEPTTGKILIHNILRCESGTTDGSFALPDSLAEGVYTVRAYTHFMKNYSDVWFFQKDIKIWQNSTKSSTDFSQINTIADCQFFPEGGDMIAGINGKVAFKAVNKWGKGVAIKGHVFDENKDTIVQFEAFHRGMGYFYLKPLQGKKYFAIVRLMDSIAANNPAQNFTFNLPESKPFGSSLIVDNVSNKRFVKVFISNNKPKTGNLGELKVVAHLRGIPFFTAIAKDTAQLIPINIPRQMIPDDGIIQITLFDNNDQPICERLIFARQNKHVNLKITPDKSVYAPREKVTLDIEATDSTGKPVKGNFSLSATDAAQVLPEKYAENIFSYLFLSSDLNGKDAILRGGIEDPAFYFDKSNKNNVVALDVLMLTQGWRRFVWKDILAGTTPTFKYMPEQALSISGTALRPNGKISKTPVSLTLFMSIDKQNIVDIASLDSNGTFVFYKNFADTANIYIKASKDKGLGILTLKLDKPHIPSVMAGQKLDSNFDENLYANFLKNTKEALDFERKLKESQEKMLQTVEVTAKKKEVSDSRRLYGKPNSSIDMAQENCGSFTNILDFIGGRVAGVQVGGNGFERQVTIRGGNNVGFLLDGINVDADLINSISPCDIEAIDVLKGPEAAIFGSRGGDGVISLLTKRGNSNYDYSKDAQYLPSNVIIQKIVGYTPLRQFYAPKYDEPKPEHEFKDRRSTLHWQPYIFTDKNGKATVSFWNSDAKTTVNVIIEGFSNIGKVGYGAAAYEVK